MGKPTEGKSLRAIPAVEKVLQALEEVKLPRPVLVAVIRRELAGLRKAAVIPSLEEVVARIQTVLEQLRQSRLQPVINGTGVLVHTNLGRAPLSGVAVEQLKSIAGQYSSLEYDLRKGERGARGGYLEHNLAIACGAEAATVVNNCAAALVLILRHFVSGERQEVVISRGELVQIGGGFRIPEILEASGACIREVGTTNKTTLSDYREAVGKRTAMVLKVHQSNFYMEGFVESVSTAELAAFCRGKRLPFVEDLGSGALFETAEIAGLEREPTPGEILKSGADMVCFSGDKLFGGPQAGIIAGRMKLVEGLKKEPFYRALRCDKLVLSALQATVDLYLGNWAEELVPVQAMLRVSVEELRSRAERICSAVNGGSLVAEVVRGKGRVGGGTLPKSEIESVAVGLKSKIETVGEIAARLRKGTPPLVGYVSSNRLMIDVRTVFPEQDEEVIRILKSLLGEEELSSMEPARTEFGQRRR